MKVGEKTVQERILGNTSVLRHAAGHDYSLLWMLQRFAKIVTLPFTPVEAETDTTYDLPDKAIVLGIFIEVVTADAGQVLDVGTLSSESGGDANGFADGVPMDNTGIIIVGPTVTVGGNETYYASTTLGALLLAGFIAGSNVDGDFGLHETEPYPTDEETAKSVSYTGDAGTDTAAGYIHLLILELP
jgi:hypothetical protein